MGFSKHGEIFWNFVFTLWGLITFYLINFCIKYLSSLQLGSDDGNAKRSSFSNTKEGSTGRNSFTNAQTPIQKACTFLGSQRDEKSVSSDDISEEGQNLIAQDLRQHIVILWKICH